MTRKLHIGETSRTEGGAVLNANAAPYVDHVCNANDLSQCDSDSFAQDHASPTCSGRVTAQTGLGRLRR